MITNIAPAIKMLVPEGFCSVCPDRCTMPRMLVVNASGYPVEAVHAANLEEDR